ncbi:MAG: helix-turn-helix domain-containing protein [Candidatus Atribacteria bacterium]|nr:helix-turn-helix domain-containing protein [Candidatus Atribacteria bacterium]
MFPIQPLRSFEQLKLLADPRRLAILRLLMAGPASLTLLGKALGEHPAWVRHHLKQLEGAGLVELVETRVQSGVVEKFYRARASGFLVQELILPENATRPVIVFSGSHDLAVELLANQLSDHLDVLTLSVGSLDGLVTLRQNLCNLSGTHLLDPSGEYNLPFIRHFFPDRAMQVVTLAHREQGLMTVAGNLKAIRSLADLARADVTFINRNPGSGTRLWLDRQLQTLGIPAESIHGYENAVSTHTECAHLVQTGKADVALGLRATAHQFGLGFLPLFHERYDIVFTQEQSTLLSPLLDTLQTSAFRRGIESLTGYETMHTGEKIPL